MTSFFVSLNLRYQPCTFSRSIYCYNCSIQHAKADEITRYRFRAALSIGELLEGYT
jgi:hypothetical protein